jgi:hypothetical protein
MAALGDLKGKQNRGQSRNTQINPVPDRLGRLLLGTR